MSPRAVAVWLGLFLLLALALRIGGNVGASYDEESGRYLYSGNDPYYHDRVVNSILEDGESVIFDEAINYPNGGMNPNPPFFDWTTALDAKFLELFGAGDPAGLALNAAVAFWGAITIIPVFMIAAELWGRKAGLWAAFFMAVSAPHIQRGVWGFADHDATTMFFITLSLAFIIKGLRALDDREYVKDWRNPAAFKEGLVNSFAHNKQAMLWSALAGTALSATALTWKGYPYVLAVLAIAVGLQLLSDHIKNKDSTALWAFYLLPLVMVTLIPLVWYGAFPTFQDTTIWAGIYVLIGVLIAGAILVPTRDLPSILVFPALALAGALGLILMLLVFPEVGRTIFTGLGYFEQTKLYTTIAEAQRSQLGRVAASFGFFTFVLAFGGLWNSFRKSWKGDAAQMQMFAWGIVAIFMAFAASRFVMNAAPVFAILTAAMMPKIVSFMRLGEVKRAFAKQHGQSPVGAAFKSLNGRAVGFALLIGMFFVLPNVWIGVDASLPCEVDNCRDPETKRLGAFGIDFDVKDNGWLDAFNHLAALDTDQALEDRPGFIAWWDYGHWATDIGKHPTVADPFQNHFNLAGRFLAAESEQEGMAWLTILMLNADYHKDDRMAYTPAVETTLSNIDDSLLEIGPMRGYDKEMAVFSAAVDLEGDEVFGLYDAVGDATGKTVGYFAVDVRMYPIDAVNRPGIFYAPTFLANKNPDDFLAYSFQGQGLSLSNAQYGVDADGNSYRLSQSLVEDAAGNSYTVVPQGGNTFTAYRGDSVPAGPGGGAAGGTTVQYVLNPTERFYNTMYASAYGHGQNGFIPGDGLSHWRVIHESDGKSVELLEYYRGATVSGTVRDDGGNPMEGVEVTFVDGFGAGHDAMTTDSTGGFSILAPFSQDDDLRLVVRDASGMELVNSTDYQFTKEQVAFGHTVNGVSLTVERGDVSGRVYWDNDNDGTFSANDTLVEATVTVGDDDVTSTGGSFSFTNVQPGAVSISVDADGFSSTSRSVTLGSGGSESIDIALTPTPSEVTFTLDDGEPVAQIPFELTGDNGFSRQLTTDESGVASTVLAPGTYSINLNFQVTQDGEAITYTANWSGVVPFGGDDRDFTVAVQSS